MKLTCSNPCMNEAFSTMDYPEYLMLFTDEGEFVVEVKFEKSTSVPIKRSITKRQISIEGIAKMLEQISANQSCLRFDDYPCFVKNIQIDPTLKTVRLNVRFIESNLI